MDEVPVGRGRVHLLGDLRGAQRRRRLHLDEAEGDLRVERRELCTFQNGGPAGECDQNQFSVPTIGPDGTVYVAFENEQNQSLWEPGEQFEDQYLMVASTKGGGSFSSPTFIVPLEDGNSRLSDQRGRTADPYGLPGFGVNSAGKRGEPDERARSTSSFADNRAGVHNSAPPSRTSTSS